MIDPCIISYCLDRYCDDVPLRLDVYKHLYMNLEQLKQSTICKRIEVDSTLVREGLRFFPIIYMRAERDMILIHACWMTNNAEHADYCSVCDSPAGARAELLVRDEIDRGQTTVVAR